MKNILFIHQSADLYGSDKMLLSLVTNLDKSEFKAIVVLPRRGPLYQELVDAGVEVHVAPLVLLSRASVRPFRLALLPFQLAISLFALCIKFWSRTFDAVHSNTLAVLSGAFFAKLIDVPHVWHVHEIVLHPRPARLFFPIALRLMADKVVCNSNATMQALLQSQPALSEKGTIIWNGLEPYISSGADCQAAQGVRQQLGMEDDAVLIAMVGRVNRLKGQRLLVEAAEIVEGAGIRNVVYLMVGGPPAGQEEYLENLKLTIASSTVSGRFVLREFERNIWPIWAAADIAVVPSTEPESFGMVALEAMACGKPVIAAAHGGLLDVIVDGETGILVPPCDKHALAGAIKRLTLDPELRAKMGSAGARRSVEKFSLDCYVKNFEKLYLNLLSKETGPQRGGEDFNIDVAARRDT